MKQILIGLCVFILLACNNNKNYDYKLSQRDSLINNFLNITDSLPGTDTLDYYRKLLKAYQNNDTNYLKKAVDETKGLIKLNYNISKINSCPAPLPINQYNFNEAYRFEYRAAFCNEMVNITVGERNDSIILLGYNYKLDLYADTCISHNKFENLLTQKQWESIKEYAFRADFWGLIPRNYELIMDGSNLVVTGYQKPVNAFGGRYNKVYRKSAEKMALGELFKLIYKSTNYQPACFDLN